MHVMNSHAETKRVVGDMKQYRLLAWPELHPEHNRIAYRRLLSDMSQRHVTIAQMADTSGLRRNAVRDFVDSLITKGVVEVRDAEAPDSFFGSLKPLGGWIRRTFVDGATANH
jgi:hypothetical protein